MHKFPALEYMCVMLLADTIIWGTFFLSVYHRKYSTDSKEKIVLASRRGWFSLWQNRNPHSDTEIRWDMLLHFIAWNKGVHPKYIMSLARDELSWSDAGYSVHVDNEHVGIKWKTTASCHKLTPGGAPHLGSCLQLLSPESTFLLSKCSDKERGVLWVLAHSQVWAQH